MNHNRKSMALIFACAVSAVSGLAESPHKGDAGQSSAWELKTTRIEDFLSLARIEQRNEVLGEEHGTYDAVLSDGAERRSAIVQTIAPYTYLGYDVRENFAYNAAAYRLDQMLGAGVVSPTALRRVEGEWVSVTLLDLPDPFVRPDAGNRVIVFRALVADSRGSFAGAFGETKELLGLQAPVVVDEHFRAALASLDRSRLDRELGGLLTERQTRFLLARRDRILRLCRIADESKGGRSN